MAQTSSENPKQQVLKKNYTQRKRSKYSVFYEKKSQEKFWLQNIKEIKMHKFSILLLLQLIALEQEYFLLAALLQTPGTEEHENNDLSQG